jgi:hypothetical protein
MKSSISRELTSCASGFLPDHRCGALPWGIASCLVRSNEKTLSISGDGGFLLSVMGLETAV